MRKISSTGILHVCIARSLKNRKYFRFKRFMKQGYFRFLWRDQAEILVGGDRPDNEYEAQRAKISWPTREYGSLWVRHTKAVSAALAHLLKSQGVSIRIKNASVTLSSVATFIKYNKLHSKTLN